MNPLRDTVLLVFSNFIYVSCHIRAFCVRGSDGGVDGRAEEIFVIRCDASAAWIRSGNNIYWLALGGRRGKDVTRGEY